MKNLLRFLKNHMRLAKMAFIFIGAVTFSIGYLLVETNNNLHTQITTLREEQATELKSMIMKIHEDAIKSGKEHVDGIIKETKEAYPSDKKDLLEEDVNHYFAGDVITTPFNTIMYKYAKDKTFNISNMNNDPFEVTVEWSYINGEWLPIIKVNGDFSKNCLSPYPRDIEEETKKHFAKGLVEKALTSTAVGGENMAVWSFLEVSKNKPWYNEVKNMTEADVDIIIELYKKYNNNLDVLSSFEFINSIPIESEKDILGNDRIISGSRTNTKAKMIFYFNNFNFVDQLTCYPEFKNKLDSYDDKILEATRENMRSKRLYLFVMVINVILVVTFGEFLNKKHKSQLIEEEDKEETM